MINLQKALSVKSIITLITIILIATDSSAADAPKNIRNEVDKLAGLNSALKTCLSSKEGKRLGSKDWLEIEKKSSKIDDFVVSLGKYFKDSFLFTSYSLIGHEYAADGKVESNVLARYKSLCSLQMQQDIMTQVEIVEKNINTLKSMK